MDIQVKNVVKINDTQIDCDLLHPKYGWIRFTASPNDSMAYSRELFNILNHPSYVSKNGVE